MAINKSRIWENFLTINNKTPFSIFPALLLVEQKLLPPNFLFIYNLLSHNITDNSSFLSIVGKYQRDYPSLPFVRCVQIFSHLGHLDNLHGLQGPHHHDAGGDHNHNHSLVHRDVITPHHTASYLTFV